MSTGNTEADRTPAVVTAAPAGPGAAAAPVAPPPAAAPPAHIPPPPVSLDAKWPVGDLMGAVDAIKQHHAQEVQAHKAQEQLQQQAGGASQGAATAAAQSAAAANPAAPADGKPLGYPGTFYLEKPLTGEEAQTIPRMWGAPSYPPPSGGAPGYPPADAPGYPPANAPGYPPANAPGYPPANAPGYPPASNPGYPPANAPGYPPANAPGYPPANAPGYPPASNPGYPPANAPGYPPASNPGYPPANAPGYPPASNPSYPPANAPGYPPASYGSNGSSSSSAYPGIHQKPAAAPAAASPYAAASAPSAPPMPSNPYPTAPAQRPAQTHSSYPQAAPSAVAQAPAASHAPPAGSGRKKAFIVGINYFGTSAQLNGCINDAKCMEYLLKTKFGFKQDSILMMTDDCPDPMRRPTRNNMFQGFRWLTMDMRPGDSLVFHYSGHGGQQRDYSGEETDGMNETLCPMDFKMAGEIVDDELNRCLINPLPTGVKLHCIIDACHSGSVMDLPFQAHVRGGYASWEASYHFTRSHKGTAGGFAVQFGASKDSQTAADTKALSGVTATGAATFCFIQAIERRGTKLSYGELLLAMHHTLQATMGQASQAPQMSGLMGMLLGGAAGGGYRGQEPVLSANFAFDLGFAFTL